MDMNTNNNTELFNKIKLKLKLDMDKLKSDNDKLKLDNDKLKLYNNELKQGFDINFSENIRYLNQIYDIGEYNSDLRRENDSLKRENDSLKRENARVGQINVNACAEILALNITLGREEEPTNNELHITIDDPEQYPIYTYYS